MQNLQSRAINNVTWHNNYWNVIQLWVHTYFITVNKIKAIEKLLHDFFYFPQAELDIGIWEKTSQVMLTKVKHQVEGRLEFVELGHLGPANFYEVDNILVLEKLKDPNLSQSSDGEL